MKKHIDKFAKELIDDGYKPSLEPSWEDALAMLEQQDKPKKSRRFIWFFVGFALFFLGGAFAVWLNTANEKANLASTEITTQQAHNKKEQILQAKESEELGLSKESKTIAPRTVLKSNVGNTATTIPQVVPQNMGNQTIPAVNSKNENQSAKQIILLKPPVADNSGSSIKNEVSVEDKAIVAKVEKNQNDAASDVKSESVVVVVEEGKAELEDLVLEKNLTIEHKTKENVFPQIVTPPVKLKPHGWKFSIAAFVGISNTISTMNATEGRWADYARRKNAEEKYAWAKGGGLEVHAQRGNWRFGLGVGYSELAKKASYNNQFVDTTLNVTTRFDRDTRLLYDSQSGQVVGTVNVLVPVRVIDTIYSVVSIGQQLIRPSMSLSYVDLPFSVGYNFSRKGWGLTPFFAGSVGFMLGYSGQAIDREQFGVFPLESQSSIFSKTNFKVRFGVDLERKLTPEISILLRPEISKQITNLYASGSGISEMPWEYRLNLGVKAGW